MEGWWEIPTPLFQSILDYQEFGRPRTDKNVDATEEVSIGSWASARLRREINHIDVELTKRLYEIEQTDDAHVQESVASALDYWSERVGEVQANFRDELRQQLATADVADADVTNIVVDDAAPSSSARASAFPQEAMRWV